MVCDRCKMVVRTELTGLGLHPASVELGEVALEEDALTEDQENLLLARLQQLGFELLAGRKERVVWQVKAAIIELVHHQNDEARIKQSEYLSKQLGQDYSYLSKIFSDEEGITIEHYIILQKIERVKELLAYDELTLSEISWQLGYSSVAALSGQFKKVVGITPTAWKADKIGRNTLDRVGARH